MSRVLVAGATGYLGGYVARELGTREHYVRALVRSPERLLESGVPAQGVFRGEVTTPSTLSGVCEGIDVVFSSIGITKQKDTLTFKDVDFQGNVNLLEEAQAAGVERFVYVSVLNGPSLRHLDIINAHEDFVDALKASGMDYAIVRPTGYFSDMGEFLKMAKRGRIYLVGRGENRMNPIHGADLASVCVDAIEGLGGEIDVGGPEVLTYRRVAELAFEALRQRPKITCVPKWIMQSATAVVRPFNRHQAGLLAFFNTMMTSDVVAPCHGGRTLSEHFRSLVAEG